MITQVLDDTSTDHLALLGRLSQNFNSSLNLSEILNIVMGEIINVTRPERVYVILREDDGELTFPVARDLNHTTIDSPQDQVSGGVIERVIEDRKPILTINAQLDNRFKGIHNVSDLGKISIMCAPLVVRDTIRGAVYVEKRMKAGMFTEEDLDLLNTIATSAAISIENARLHCEAVEKTRMEHELQVARKVQRDFIPRMICQPLNWEISAHLEAAREVGGDFYDVISLDEDRLVGLVIGDVCDKGVGAALFMALFRSLIRAFAEQHVCADGRFSTISSEDDAYSPRINEIHINQSPIDINTLVNTVYLTNQYIINHHQISNMFTTLFFAVIDPLTGTMEYVNCGHEPPIVLSKQGNKVRLNPTGPVLGVLPGMKFGVNQFILSPGDTLLAYTDGVIDARDPNGRPFSEERLLSLTQSPSVSTDLLLRKITDELQDHIGDRERYDDITLLAARWKLADPQVLLERESEMI